MGHFVEVIHYDTTTLLEWFLFSAYIDYIEVVMVTTSLIQN